MARRLALIIAFFLFLLAVFFTGPAGADVGVGLHATANSGTLAEGGTLCVKYIIYNPFGTDVNATLMAEGEIARLVTRVDGPVSLQGRTGLEGGHEATICFSKKGVLGKACEERSYSGYVAASITGGEGIGASAQPLRLTVTCGGDYYRTVMAAIVALALAFALL